MNRHLDSDGMAAWIIGERAPDAEQHLFGCSQCRSKVEELAAAFGQFRESGRRWSEHWYAEGGAHPLQAAAPRRWWAVAAGVAAVMLAAVLVVNRSVPPDAEAAFLPIPYVAPLAPYEQVQVT